MARTASRVAALDLAKGTAIVLVVIGHVVSRNNYAPGAEWYLDMRALVYLFHMPLFMAGAVLRAVAAAWRGKTETFRLYHRLRQMCEKPRRAPPCLQPGWAPTFGGGA